jgi:hypothetical protein
MSDEQPDGFFVVAGSMDDDDRCRVEVIFSRKQANGWVPLVPPERVRVDTSIRSLVLTPGVARDLHLPLVDFVPGVRGTKVAYQLNDATGRRVWLEEVKALVPDDAEECIIGITLLKQWRFEIDGPARSFRLLVPKPPVGLARPE